MTNVEGELESANGWLGKAIDLEGDVPDLATAILILANEVRGVREELFMARVDPDCTNAVCRSIEELTADLTLSVAKSIDDLGTELAEEIKFVGMNI